MLKIKHFSISIVTEYHRDKIPQHLLYLNIVKSQNLPKMTLVVFYSQGLIYSLLYHVRNCQYGIVRLSYVIIGIRQLFLFEI